MKFDVFFSISQTEVDGYTPSESEMFNSFFDQVRLADELGYGTAWIAESHLSSEVQKQGPSPVIPHWKGEVGLNVDICQIAQAIFNQTKNIEVGSAISNIICNGGPIAAAERVAYFLALHGLNETEKRRLNLGFAYGRFEFMNRVHGIKPRNEFEQKFWKVIKGKVFNEAAQIFLRLLRGDILSSDDLPKQYLIRSDFRSNEDWNEACGFFLDSEDKIFLPARWEFEKIKIIPQDYRRELLQCITGSHDPKVQEAVNWILPCQVFNLSITQADVIENTHNRLSKAYHKNGGAWKREYMPRTVFVFINEEEELSPEKRSETAKAEAKSALSAYWTALQGTLDPSKVEKAANNALVGNAQEIVEQIKERFHPEDRLMLWFDFFNHDNERVKRNMSAFKNKVCSQLI